MDHIVCLDSGSNELENLIRGNKSMIIRATQSRTLIHGKVNPGDILYFVNNKCEDEIRARGIVSSVFFSDKLTVEESFETVIRNQDRLQLPDKQFEKIAGKSYLILIGLEDIEQMEPLRFVRKMFSMMEDWLPVGRIEEYVSTANGIFSV